MQIYLTKIEVQELKICRFELNGKVIRFLKDSFQRYQISCDGTRFKFL